MTIGEIVGEGLGVHFNLKKDEINKKIDKVMNDVGINTEAKNKYPDIYFLLQYLSQHHSLLYRSFYLFHLFLN